MKTNLPRAFPPDLIRAVAIVGVVLLHCTMDPPPVFGAQWWLSTALQGASRASIPLFVLLSGYLLLPRAPEEPAVFWGKRVRKLVIPLAVWSGIYLAWRHWHYGEPLAYSLVLGPLAGQPAYYHLWYFYLVLGLMMFVPWLRRVVSFQASPAWGGFALVWLASLTAVPLAHQVFGGGIQAEYFTVTGYGGYFLVGGALATLQLNARQLRLLTAAAALALAATIGGTRLLTSLAGMRTTTLFDFTKPNTAVAAVSLFAVICCRPAPLRLNPMCRWLVARLSEACLGIYVLHPLVLELGGEGWLGPWWGPAGMIGRAVFLLAACGLVCLLLRRIPFVRACVP
jgi:surface polysaccharide O-acyltransferase-like enzyme